MALGDDDVTDGDDPGFDPQAHARRQQSKPQRGQRFRNLLYGTLGLGVLGGVGLQAWLFARGEPEAEAAAPIQAAGTTVAEPRLAEAAPPPPPVPDVAEVRRERVPDRPREPPLPTRVAFAVQPQGEPDLGWFQDGRRPRLAHGCALRPGASTIPAALETTVQSEVGGQAVATVTEDVLDADGVGRLLIPAGTKAVGRYKTEGRLDFQARRLKFVWTELTLPDGSQLALGDADGMDVAGSMGVGGEVDTRWGELVATAALLTVFDGIQRGGISNDPGLLGGLQDAASSNTGRLGRDVTGRVLDWEPDILIRAGTRIRISPVRTVQVC